MSVLDLHMNPSRRELRWFGVLIFLFAGLIGGLVLWRARSLEVATVIWSIGAVSCLFFYAVRPLRLPMFRLWMCDGDAGHFERPSLEEQAAIHDPDHPPRS